MSKNNPSRQYVLVGLRFSKLILFGDMPSEINTQLHFQVIKLRPNKQKEKTKKIIQAYWAKSVQNYYIKTFKTACQKEILKPLLFCI